VPFQLYTYVAVPDTIVMKYIVILNTGKYEPDISKNEVKSQPKLKKFPKQIHTIKPFSYLDCLEICNTNNLVDLQVEITGKYDPLFKKHNIYLFSCLSL